MKLVKSLWNSFKVAFAMFSKIPMPRADWTKENMKYMFCFFPVIGMVIGAVMLGAAWCGNALGLNNSFLTVIVLLVPVLITGGIHVDGLLDTADALSSWQERARRLEILKDSHAGAFAVITACVYFLCMYGAYSWDVRNWRVLMVLACGFAVSRCFSGIGVITLPKAKTSGTVAEFSRKAEDIPVRNTLIVILVLMGVLMITAAPVIGAAAFVSACLTYVYYRHMALKYFGGTTGDLSGWFLCICEAVMAIVAGIVYAVMGIL